MVEGGMTCIKYILAVFNFVFVIFGILLIVFGAQSLSEAQNFKSILESTDYIAVFCVVVGALLVLISFLGCCGSLKENQCMLVTFAVVLIIILIVEVVIGGLGIAFKSEARTFVDERINTTLSKYNFENSEDKYTVIIDELQWKMACCGINNYTDWIERFNRLPGSCCAQTESDTVLINGGENVKNQQDCTENSPKLFHDACLEKIVNTAKKIYGPVALIAITVAVLELLGIIFACCLIYAVKKEYQVV